ncbi:MAG: hypothetical protein HC822_04955 [Oscillochloris sp.]|nr:hypothetical protein [Oscillochloris sp.]
MGLSDRAVMRLEDRLRYEPEHNLVFANFEGLGIHTKVELDALSHFLDAWFAAVGHKVNVIINYDNFSLSAHLADAYYAMVRRNTGRYFLSSTRYSTNAFFRRQLGAGLAGVTDPDRIYRTFEQARDGL